MSKLFFQNYHYHCWLRYGEVLPKYEHEMDIGLSTEKYDEFWILWGIFKEHIKQNIFMAVLRKANAHLVAIGILIKKSI